MSTLMKLALALLMLGFGASCANQPAAQATGGIRKWRVSNVRTTAYTHTEQGGSRNAVGSRLSGKNVQSAAADWSRFPLGTRFRIVDTNEVFQIDDYGSALIGTNTIDLYKTSRLEMRRWGTRRVDIDVLEWGSDTRSLAVLTPRSRNGKVRRMVVALKDKKPTTQPPVLKF